MSADNYFIGDQNAPNFLTFTVVDWIDVFTREVYKNVIVDSLNYCIENKGLIIYAWCLMSNHLHLVVQAMEGFRISDIIRDFKKFSSKKIFESVKSPNESRREWMLYRFRFAGKYTNRVKNYKFRQDTNHAILLDSSEIIDQKVNYFHQNPVIALIVRNPEDYLFSSASDFCGL